MFDPNNPRFFIALVPPQTIQDYANGVIQELTDRYQMRTSKAPPHVTLQAPFQWQRDRLPELEAGLETFARNQPAVTVNLSGFSSFAPRVLYINVVRSPALLHLQAQLMAMLEQQFNLVDPKAKQRPFAPHMTVASRNVTRQSFKQAWEVLQARSVEFEWMGDRLTLLIHNGQRWNLQAEFPLVS